MLSLYISGSSLMHVVNLIAALLVSSLGFHITWSDDALPPWLKGRLSFLASVCASIILRVRAFLPGRAVSTSRMPAYLFWQRSCTTVCVCPVKDCQFSMTGFILRCLPISSRFCNFLGSLGSIHAIKAELPPFFSL